MEISSRKIPVITPNAVQPKPGDTEGSPTPGKMTRLMRWMGFRTRSPQPITLPVAKPLSKAKPVSEKPVAAPARFDRLPDAVFNIIADQSKLPDVQSFAKTNKTNRELAAPYLNRFLSDQCKTEFADELRSGKVDYATLYDNPTNRKGKFIPTKFLQQMGITHQYLINQIQSEKISVKDALNVIDRNQKMLTEWEGDIAHSGVVDLLKNPIIRSYIESGVILDIHQIYRMEGLFCKRIFLYPKEGKPIRNLLDSGALTMHDERERRLTTPRIQVLIHYEKNCMGNRALVEKVLRIDTPERDALLNPVVRDQINKGERSIESVLNMKERELAELAKLK